MKQIGNRWEAEEGMFFVRKSDNTVMGESLYLGESDDISNYKEVPITEEEIEEFHKKYDYIPVENIISDELDSEGVF